MIERLKALMLEPRRKARLEKQMVELFGYLSSALEAGVGLSHAIDASADDFSKPLGDELMRMKKEISVGIPVEEAAVSFAGRVKSEESQMFAEAIWGLRKSGGDLVLVFKRLAAASLERQRVREKVSTLGFQVRMEGMMLSVFPFALGAALEIVFPGYLAPFFENKLGALLGAAGLLWLSLGFWMLMKMGKVEV